MAHASVLAGDLAITTRPRTSLRLRLPGCISGNPESRAAFGHGLGRLRLRLHPIRVWFRICGESWTPAPLSHHGGPWKFENVQKWYQVTLGGIPDRLYKCQFFRFFSEIQWNLTLDYPRNSPKSHRRLPTIIKNHPKYGKMLTKHVKHVPTISNKSPQKYNANVWSCFFLYFQPHLQVCWGLLGIPLLENKKGFKFLGFLVSKKSSCFQTIFVTYFTKLPFHVFDRYEININDFGDFSRESSSFFGARLFQKCRSFGFPNFRDL